MRKKLDVALLVLVTGALAIALIIHKVKSDRFQSKVNELEGEMASLKSKLEAYERTDSELKQACLQAEIHIQTKAKEAKKQEEELKKRIKEFRGN